MVVLLQGRQHADDLSCDESVVEALLGHRLQRETAVHLHCGLRVRWLQLLHKLDVGIMDLDSQLIHQPNLIWITSIGGNHCRSIEEMPEIEM